MFTPLSVGSSREPDTLPDGERGSHKAKRPLDFSKGRFISLLAAPRLESAIQPTANVPEKKWLIYSGRAFALGRVSHPLTPSRSGRENPDLHVEVFYF